MWWRKRRVAEEEALLAALIRGANLKVHRDLDGTKTHKLYPLDHPPTIIHERLVRRLEVQHLIQSNMKFPAATYLLTEKGAALARELSGRLEEPLTVRVTRNI